jgi:hypothetical protein
MVRSIVRRCTGSTVAIFVIFGAAVLIVPLLVYLNR